MRDFGGTGRVVPREVVRPSSVRDVVEAVLKGPVVARGCGHSTDGRSLTSDVSLDMRGLATVHQVRDDRVDVDAGATWRQVLQAVLPLGRTPPVLTDFLDLTVGGTLSAGGVGGTSHVHGLQVENVSWVEVVTPDGRIVRSSARKGHGVIVRASLRLVPAPRRVLSCTVTCQDAAELLRVQTLTRADHLAGQAHPLEAGGWRYEAKAVLYNGTVPPAGLRVTETEELSFWEFADRLRPDVEELIALGEWARPHPWAMAFLPTSRAAAFIENTLAPMSPADIGLSGVVLIKALKDSVLFGLLRTASPGCTSAASMAEANKEFHTRVLEAGGEPYPA